MKPLFIIGHKNPDTDSIVSSLILSKKIKRIISFDNLKPEARSLGELNKETKFVLNYFKEKNPLLIKNGRKKNVFLVDHGEYGQSVEGVEEAEIIGVIDHHKIGGIKTESPIFYRAEPLGSTATILTKIFQGKNIKLTKKEAGLLLAAIISDTLNLTSPTTTREDKKAVSFLSKISGENPATLAKEMFKAKSDISNISSENLIKNDYKDFESSGIKFGVGVCETTNQEEVKKRREEIVSCLSKIKKEYKVSFIFFALIDILKNNTELFFIEEEKKTAEKIFKKRSKNNSIYLPGVSSRKKQILPPIINFLKK